MIYGKKTKIPKYGDIRFQRGCSNMYIQQKLLNGVSFDPSWIYLSVKGGVRFLEGARDTFIQASALDGNQNANLEAEFFFN